MSAGDDSRLGVLVTRPGRQCRTLCSLLETRGYLAYPWPAIEIHGEHLPGEGASPLADARPEDLTIFVSRNAVTYGASLLSGKTRPRVAAIGPSTARALIDFGLPPDIRPPGFNSESLLSEHSLQSVQGKTVYIIRGVGGREKLASELRRRGAEVVYVEVYRRETRVPQEEDKLTLFDVWQRGGIGIYTATSVEILQSLHVGLGQRFGRLLAETPLVTASRRVVQRSVQLHHRAERILSPGPDDQSLVEAIATWHGEARVTAGRQEQKR